VTGGRRDDLLAYRSRGPDAMRNHPTEEHLLPLFVAAGAGTTGRGERLHASYTYGAFAMDAYRFD
jgi:4,5-DOPA dioxygenase extradiol